MSLYLPRVKEVNDPFDCSPIFCDTPDEPQFQRALYSNVIRQGIISRVVSFDEFLRTRYPSNSAALKKMIGESARKVYEIFNDKLCVVCVSSVHDNVLMWSHYASDHEGVVFELDFNRIIADGTALKMFPVKYQNNRPIINLLMHDLDKDIFRSQIQNAVLYKAKFWEYESEYRTVIHLDIHPPGLIIQNEDEKAFLLINPGAITAIYFGYRCNEDTISEIQASLRNKGLMQIPMYRAKVSKNLYKIEFDSVN